MLSRTPTGVSNSNTSMARSNSSYTSIVDEDAYGPPEAPWTPPPQQRQTIFRITNMSSPQSGSPPPAYGAADHVRGKQRGLGLGNDNKRPESRIPEAQREFESRVESGRANDKSFGGELDADDVWDNIYRDVDQRERSDSDLGARSEETVTLHSRQNVEAVQQNPTNGDDDRPLGQRANRIADTLPSHSRLATPPSSSSFRLHLSTPSRTENDITNNSVPSPPPSPVT